MKTKLMIAAISTVILVSCGKKPELPSLDTVPGTYNGTLTAGANSISAFTQVSMNNNIVGFGIGETGQGPSMVLDSILITAGESSYSLSHTGGFSGTVNGTTLTWADSYYSFTGTK